MKPFKIIQLLIFITTTFILSSCEKYLDKKSDTSLNVPTTIENFQAILDRSIVMNQSSPSSGIASCDDYFLLPSIYSVLPDQLTNVYKWTPFDQLYQNDWSENYFPVYPSNLALEGLNNIAISADNQLRWNNVKGSALFYRAYSFLNLIWIYGKAFDENTSSTDLGISLRLSSDFNKPTTRASVRESYNQIISDLKEALKFLPQLPQNTFRPSKSASYAMLARTYLSMRDYDNAIIYADSCLHLQSYIMDFNNDPGIRDLDMFVPFNDYKLNKEIIYFSSSNRLNPLFLYGLGYVDTSLYQTYHDNDKRKNGFFSLLGTYYGFKGNYSGDAGTNFTGLATDEIYLIRAECYARKGNKTEALADLDKLLQNRYTTGTFIPTTAVDANEALDIILLERRKELLWRGLRWIDLKRLNKEGRNLVPTRLLPDGSIVTLQPNANYYALPIPKDIIDITGIPQNPY